MSTCTGAGEPLPAAISSHPPDALRRAHAVARAVLGCDHLADDALQEALVACWHAPAPRDPCAWLVQTVLFRSRHLRRTLRRRQRREQHAAAARCAHHADCDNPLHTAHAHELRERLQRALAALPPERRTVFELHEYEGLDYAAIAAHLGLPAGTVRSRLHRARAALQAAFAADAPAAGR